MPNQYVLHYSDDAIKSPLLINPRTINKRDSSLTLYGKGVHDYGESAQEDLLHLLENFCSDISPPSPTEGQLWYDSTNKILKVCKGFQVNPLIPAINLADPTDLHYARDINGIRIPIWHTIA